MIYIKTVFSLLVVLLILALVKFEAEARRMYKLIIFIDFLIPAGAVVILALIIAYIWS